MGRLDESVASYRQALQIRPDYAGAYNNFGITLQEMNRLDEAEASFQRALQIDPYFAEAHNNMGNMLKELNRLDEAVASYRRALQIKPNYAEAYNNLGITLKELGRLDESVASYRQALQIKPNCAEAYNNLGITLMELGQLDESAASYRQALQIKPDFSMAYSNMLLNLQYMNTVSPLDIFAEHQRYSARFEAPLKPQWQSHQNSREPQRRLNVGYISGDFRNHSVAFFIEPILASHDKSQVEIYCYYSHTQHDRFTDRIAACADHWLVCAHMSDDQLAERIRADGIDILVDLSGHTAHNRLPVFARKPAPLQVTLVGYAGTTGLSAINYRITDSYMDPVGLAERYHSETLIRLPGTGVSYRPDPASPPVNELPALAADGSSFTFASLNNLTKINASVIVLWSRLLKALPHARLMLGNVMESRVRQNIIAKFEKEGIAAERLLMQPKLAFLDYLALHQAIDLALDPFPYNGGTTTLHSLWMGVPVITLAGQRAVSRIGVAALSLIGLTEFITHNEDEYIQRALQFAQDLPRLNDIRQSLRDRIIKHSSYDDRTITSHLENIYRDIWRKWCNDGCLT